MSNYIPTTAYPQTEDSLLDVQKRALFKRSFTLTTALASASRTVTTNTGTISNSGFKGIMVSLTITSISAGGLKIRITGGVGVFNTIYLDSTSLTSVTSRTVVVYPGFVSGSVQLGTSGVLGSTFSIQIEPDTADSITYSVSYILIE